MARRQRPQRLDGGSARRLARLPRRLRRILLALLRGHLPRDERPLLLLPLEILEGEPALLFLALGGSGHRELALSDVEGLRTLVAAADLEVHLRAFLQRAEAVAVDVTVVDEEILAPVLRCDEAEALVVVEPLDGSGCHVITSTAQSAANAAGAESNNGGRLPEYRRVCVRPNKPPVASLVVVTPPPWHP